MAKIIPIRSRRELAAASRRVPHLPAPALQQHGDKLASLEMDVLALLGSRDTTASDAARALIGVLVKLAHVHRLPVDDLIMTALINRQMLAMADLGLVAEEDDPEDAG
jgi:hypothetical protein